MTAAKILNQRCIFEVDRFMLQVALVRGGFHASLRKLAFPSLTRSWPYSALPRRPRETLNDFNELVVRSATGIAKLVDLMFVREPVQAH